MIPFDDDNDGVAEDGFIIVGCTDVTSTNSDVWVICIDYSKNFLWAEDYGGASNNIAYSVIYTAENPGDARGQEFIDIRFKNELEGFALCSGSQTIYTVDGGATWQFTFDESGTQLIPEWGSYLALAGVNDLYLIGRNGGVTKRE